MWTSWFVLAACAVITQSFPRPDEEYQIPDVELGQRSQYYVLHDDGDFKYGYNTGDGAYESAVKMGSGDLTGFYGYNDAFGENVRLDYTAGVGGFIPRSSLLPVAPDVGAAAVRSAGSGLTYGGVSGVISKSTAPSQSFVKSAPTSPVFSHEEASIRSGASADGGYDFSYTNSDSSRSESADANNNVVGQYSFVADDGVNHEIRYKASSATGYVAEGDSLPVAPEAPTAAAATAPALVDNAPLQTILSTLYTSPFPITSQQNSIITSGSSGGASFRGRGVPDDIIFGSDSGNDGSYSFSYTNPDSSRSESADSDLNVRGDYSFIADDGITRQVRYRAGSGTGFVAEGAHLPVPVSDTSSGATSGNGGKQKVYSAGSATKASQTSGSISGTSEVASFRGRGVPGDIIFGSDSGNDGSYKFSYTNPDSSRSESADSELNVIGDYSFIADDGITRQVRYRAGSGTGFVAEGAHLPVPVSDTHSGATSGNGGKQKVYSAGSATKASQTSGSISGTSEVASFRGRGVPGDIIFGSDSDNDGSYKFSYTNPDSSRSESADSDLNVIGDYSFIADDGITRQVRYRAGSGTGFVAEGAHLPVPVSDTPSGATSGNGGKQKVYSAGSTIKAIQTSGTSGTSEVASFRGRGVPGDIIFGSDSGNDGSYKFSYTNPDSSRSESADSDLNVRGDYSFIADDGITRQVRYRAGSGTGFVAEGAHLPVPVSDTSSGATSGNGGKHKVYSAGSTIKATQTSGTSGLSEVASFRGRGVPGDIIFGGDSGNAASYSFSYTNPDSSRSESADASNNVVGEYSFIADDGQNRQIRYRAGSGTGFIAEGDSIPVAPEVPVVQQETSDTIRSEGQASSGYTFQAPSVSFSAPSQLASTRSSSSSSSSVGHLLGNVHVRQYPVERGRKKFGYVFTEV